jgi:hypothetical protein
MFDTARMLAMRAAVARGTDDADAGFSGVYTWQPPPRRAHEAWLKCRGVPWAIRKIVLGAARKTEVVITHAPFREPALPASSLVSRQRDS